MKKRDAIVYITIHDIKNTTNKKVNLNNISITVDFNTYDPFPAPQSIQKIKDLTQEIIHEDLTDIIQVYKNQEKEKYPIARAIVTEKDNTKIQLQPDNKVTKTEFESILLKKTY